MKIETTYVQVTDGSPPQRYGCGEDTIDVADSVLEGMTIGEMFRWFQREHGRCTGKVYVDYLHADSKFGPYAIGWVFVKRQKYDDSNETFLMETWVTLLDKDETKRIVEYHNIGRVT